MKFVDLFKNKNNNKATNSECLFFDDDTGLEWFRVDDVANDRVENAFNELRTWSKDQAVQRFIAQKFSLDLIFKSFICDAKNHCVKYYSNLYFCYENKNVVGISFLSQPHGDNDYSTIEYLLVNPNFYNKGIGTRMVSSISKNTDFFFGKNHGSGIMASVEETNKKSENVFSKNNFSMIGRNRSDAGRVYSIFFKKLDDCNLNNDEKSL